MGWIREGVEEFRALRVRGCSKAFKGLGRALGCVAQASGLGFEVYTNSP